MPGDTLLDNVEDDIAAQVAKQIEPLQEKTTDLIKSVEKVILDIESVFSSEATANFLLRSKTCNAPWSLWKPPRPTWTARLRKTGATSNA